MIDLKTKLARAAWDLGPISKTQIPKDILRELVDDFATRQDVTVILIEQLDELNSFTVVVQGNECLEMYADWMQTFEVHGYEAPFLVFDNSASDDVS